MKWNFPRHVICQDPASKSWTVFGIPRSASSSHTVSHCSLFTAAHTRSRFSDVLLVAGLPEHGSLSTDSQPSLKHLCHTFICAALIFIPERLLNHPNSFCGGMFKPNAKFDTDSLLYSLSHFECDDHTVPLLTQLCLLSPLTSAVKLSLFIICIPVHSPWLPGYIDVSQIILIILRMAGLFPDRPDI